MRRALPITVARPCRNYTGFFAPVRFLPNRSECAAASISWEVILATRLKLLCCGATAASRTAAFPRRDEPLDEGGRRLAAGRTIGGPAPVLAFVAPDPAARETASLMHIGAELEPLLADIDHGDWTGRSLVELQASDAAGLARWLAEPASGAPGGENLAAVAARVGPWLDRMATADTTVLAVTHPAVIRAAIAHALGCPIETTLNIDIAPLSETLLSFNRRWRLQGLIPTCGAPDL
jgi:broad specificity phosphatase PhoE